MTDECRHGLEHYHHHHHHIGVAEGMTPVYTKKLQMVMGLSVLYFVVQAVGSYFSGSLALMADAGHKLADIGAIGLALTASWFSHLRTSPRKTFGYFRLEILAALINASVLIGIAFYILYEALHRLSNHPEVEGGIMLVVSVAGLILNLMSARILYPSKELNLNIKGALFHVMTDILDSLGTMLTAGAIMLFQAGWMDTAISIVIASLVLFNAFRLFREAGSILMEAAPRHLRVDKIREFITTRPGVLDVHDLHVWTITTGKDALLAHVKVDGNTFRHETARRLEKDLRDTYDLCHITIQLEPPGFEEEAIPF